MNILLDTHVLLWSLSEPQKLQPAHQQLIVDPTNTVAASAINIAEISIKYSLGKLVMDEDLIRDDHAMLLSAIEEQGFSMLPFAAHHAARLSSLPFHHRDPFDRMIIAQALAERWTVVTVDPAFNRYDELRIAHSTP